ncbi:MAG: dihydrofolate reductase [Saprospiraceae bacterium]
MIISTIVAVAQNNVIGRDNDIPWYLPADLKYFKKTTLGHHIIMGRKCFQSIGRPLPKRTNVIVTRNPFFVVSNALVVNSIEEGIEIARQNGEEEVFIIGGGQIYDLSQSLWDRIYLTEVDLQVDGDIFFPTIDSADWKEVSCEAHEADEKNKYNYVFKVFERSAIENGNV